MARSALQFDASFDTIDGQAQSALANPDQVTAASQAVIQNSFGNAPDITPPTDNTVTLAQGVLRGGEWKRDAEVRELNGDDEEALAKIGNSWLRFLDTIVTRGTVSIGGIPMTKEMGDELLIGDREDLIRGVRIATFGETLDIEDHECNSCGLKSDLSVNLRTVPYVEMEPGNRLEVELRNGTPLIFRFPNGADQRAVYTDPEWTPAEQNTQLLARCLVSFDGVAPLGSSVLHVKKLGLADRRKILKELAEAQPGPRFDRIEYTHEACGTVIALPLGLADMFLGV